MSTIINYPPTVVEPPNHLGVLIYLHGQGGNGTAIADSFQLEAGPRHFKGVFPHASIKTSQFGHTTSAWIGPFGVRDTEQLVQDARSVRAEAAYVHELIESEIRKGTPSNKIFIGGTGMGGALALYAGLTFKNPLAGIFMVSSWIPVKHVLLHRPITNLDTFVMHVRGSADPPLNSADMHLNLREVMHPGTYIPSEDNIVGRLSDFLLRHVDDGTPVAPRRKCYIL